MADRISVLLDTDPGSDIDDAVALAYLLRQPRCELVGVTTVSGDVAKRAALVQMLCETAGQPNVPIHAGLSGSLLHGTGQPNVPQYEPVKHRPHRTDFRKGTAVEFMRDTIRSRPGEITLLSVGPFTNVATLFALDPEIPSLLKDMVSMAGVFSRPHPWGDNEWNCKVDSIATAITYARVPKGHLSVGLDVTAKCQLDADEVNQRFTGPLLELVREMSTAWFSGDHKHMTFHDPLAAALLFKPELCQYATGTITVEVNEDKKLGGRTPFVASADGPHRIAMEVDREAFFEEYFSVFK
ncbi:MAG TPA: nucleoside hydrolase [Tepidisphaeraceae bacterium]|jgi:purine nucleosidase|nr:nucleoside hydrolase [Tepidisphaeraceae bacterium]